MNIDNDIQSCRRLLLEISEMCDHATLTGSLEGGERRTAIRYNALLERLVETGNVPEGLFSSLPETSAYGEIGVEARMLASYFPDERKQKNRHEEDGDRGILMRLAPFVGKEELALLIRDQAEKGHGLDMNTLSALAPFLGQSMLGELLRQHLSKKNPPDSPSAPSATAPKPNPPAAPEAAVRTIEPDMTPEPVRPEKESLGSVLDLLKSPYLSDQDRNALVERIRAATESLEKRPTS